jgi:CheY-like chemotaxis protein
MPGKKRLLCIDDHEDTCALVSSILPDFEVRSEHTEAGGLSRAASKKFDVILADYYLPDGTGLELCELIRAFDPSTPILVITATHKITHEQVVAVGGQGVIRKERLSQILPIAIARVLELRIPQSRRAGKPTH